MTDPTPNAFCNKLMLVAERMNVRHDYRFVEFYHAARPVRQKRRRQDSRRFIELVFFQLLSQAYLEVRPQLAQIIGIGPQEHHYLGGGVRVRLFRFRANPVGPLLHALVQHHEVEPRRLFCAHKRDIAAAVIPVGRSVMPGAFS